LKKESTMKRDEAKDLLQRTIHDRLAAAGELTPLSISRAVADSIMSISEGESTAPGDDAAAKPAKPAKPAKEKAAPEAE
jgi:hypothetical protein